MKTRIIGICTNIPMFTVSFSSVSGTIFEKNISHIDNDLTNKVHFMDLVAISMAYKEEWKS